MTDDVIQLQETVAFLEEKVHDLNKALLGKEAAITMLERRVDALENAVRTLARKSEGDEEVLGAMPENDPVPRSG